MKHFSSIATFAAALLIAVPAMSSDYKRITKQADFQQTVVGKKVSADWGWISMAADGTVSGNNPARGPVTGTWNWKGKHWCRQIMVGDLDRGYDCQVVMVNGNNIVFIRDKGKGEQVHMKLQ